MEVYMDHARVYIAERSYRKDENYTTITTGLVLTVAFKVCNDDLPPALQWQAHSDDRPKR